MSDYPSDDVVKAWWDGDGPDEVTGDACRRVARNAVDWARSQDDAMWNRLNAIAREVNAAVPDPAPQEPPIVDDPDDDGWYSYDPCGGLTSHDSADEAREATKEALKDYRDEALGDEWGLDAGFLHWGRLVPHGWTEEVTEGEHTDYVMREAAPQEPTCSVCGFTPCLGPKCRLATPRTSADKPPAPRDALVKHDEPCCPRNPSPTPEPR